MMWYMLWFDIVYDMVKYGVVWYCMVYGIIVTWYDVVYAMV